MGSVTFPISAGVLMETGTVGSSQTTTSGSYTDLSTSGPSVTLTTGTKALVIVSCQMANSGANSLSYMDYTITGSTSRSASDGTAVILRQTNAASGQNQDLRSSSASIVSLTAGSNVFTAKYKVSGGTGTFSNREICVVSL
jgi:hypothetical protein